MKKILKLAGGFLLGAFIGGGIVVAGIALFGDIPLEEFGSKVVRLGVFKLAGSALMGIVLTALSFFLQIVLHEGGHLVCGLLSGYRFLSFRIFSLTFVRQDGHLRVKRYKLASTGGQCLLAPPDGFDLLFGLTGLFLAALNGIPSKLGGLCNDAYNIRLLLRRPADVRYMWIQLSAAALIQTGTRPKDLPDEWFAHSATHIDYADLLQVSMPLMQVSRLQDEERWDEAYTLLEEVYAHRDQLLGIYRLETEAELLFTALVLGKEACARALWTDTLKTYVEAHSRVSSTKQRILFAVALYMENDEAKARTILQTVENRRADYLMQGEAVMDIALMQSLLEKL